MSSWALTRLLTAVAPSQVTVEPSGVTLEVMAVPDSRREGIASAVGFLAAAAAAAAASAAAVPAAFWPPVEEFTDLDDGAAGLRLLRPSRGGGGGLRPWRRVWCLSWQTVHLAGVGHDLATWADEKQWKHKCFSRIFATLSSGASWANDAHFSMVWMLPQKLQWSVDWVLEGELASLSAYVVV